MNASKTALAGECGEGKMYSAGTPNTATGGGRAPQSAFCGFCLAAFALSKWLFKNIKMTKRTLSISDFRYTIYEPVAASRRHARSGFPRQNEGTIKHAILRNEAKFREGLLFGQVAMGQSVVREFWSYFRRAILKNEAKLCIYDFRLPICDFRSRRITVSQHVARRMQSPRPRVQNPSESK
jgi:hypothetical protein